LQQQQRLSNAIWFEFVSPRTSIRPNVAMSSSDSEAYGWRGGGNAQRSVWNGWGGGKGKGKAQGIQQGRGMQPLQPTEVQQLQHDPALQNRVQTLQLTVQQQATQIEEIGEKLKESDRLLQQQQHIASQLKDREIELLQTIQGLRNQVDVVQAAGEAEMFRLLNRIGEIHSWEGNVRQQLAQGLAQFFGAPGARTAERAIDFVIASDAQATAAATAAPTESAAVTAANLISDEDARAIAEANGYYSDDDPDIAKATAEPMESMNTHHSDPDDNDPDVAKATAESWESAKERQYHII